MSEYLRETIEDGKPVANPPDGAAPLEQRYPFEKLPFVSEWMPDDERFAEALEDFLVGYGFNTARAYLGDLVDIYDWASRRGQNFFELTELDLKPYLALLRRRDYSENTIRRRVTAWRQFQRRKEAATD